MKLRSIVALAGLLVFSASCAHKQTVVVEGEHQQAKIEKKVEKKESNNLAYTCLVGKDQRTVTMDKKEKRCEVNYTKFGDIQQVAWAEATPSICDRAFNNIRSNIEGSGYKCQEGTEFKIDTKKKEEIKKPRETAAAGK